MWYRLAYGKPKLLINPIVGGFWVGDRFINYGEQLGVIELRKLLQTKPDHINTQEKLNSFLSNSNRFEIIDGKRIYLRDVQSQAKSLKIPFDFYVNNQEIRKDEVYSLSELKKLLQTFGPNINTQDMLNLFLSNPNRFETIDGKKIYIRTPVGKSKNLIIPFDFYIGEEKIQKGQVFGVKKIEKLLQTGRRNINTV